MVYKKFIKKDGKVYGPYIYHSKRVDGKVVSEYHGPKKSLNINLKKSFWIFAVVVVVLLLAFLIKPLGNKLSGKAIFDLNANYNQGESLDGILTFSLKQGELLPADSQLVFENAGKEYVYNLSEVLSEEPVEGSFYILGKNISGEGYGYGIEGKNSFNDSGFGEDYLGGDFKSYEIELSNLNLTLDEGGLSASIVYSGERVVSLIKILSDDAPVDEEIIPEPEITENISSNESAKQINLSSSELTEDEKQIIKNEYGDEEIKIVRSEVIGDKLYRGYQLREQRIEYVYDYPQEQEILYAKISEDLVKWLKQIIEVVSQNETSSESVEININSSVY